jgi:hypothetical protein
VFELLQQPQDPGQDTALSQAVGDVQELLDSWGALGDAPQHPLQRRPLLGGQALQKRLVSLVHDPFPPHLPNRLANQKRSKAAFTARKARIPPRRRQSG